MHRDLSELQERNRKVELDKAREISKTRRAIIALATYLVAVIFLWTIGAPRPWLTALVPTVGFLFSTLTLPFFRRRWIENIYKK